MTEGFQICNRHFSDNDWQSSDKSGNPIVCFVCIKPNVLNKGKNPYLAYWDTTSYFVGVVLESGTFGYDHKTL